MLCYNCMREKGDSPVCPHCGCEKQPVPAPHHLAPGTVIGNRYTIGRVLGEGGFGITYLALDHILDAVVAIKEYFPYGFSHRVNTVSNTVTVSSGDTGSFFSKGKNRFLNEAKNVARFRNEPGIVIVIDFIEENNTAYIVMEYLDGIDLRNYLRQNGALTVDQTLDLLMPVIKSLYKMHQSGIIHRDISPDNLMVLKDGSVKLMDFGAAREYVGDERSMSVMLKKGYAPEEQYRSNGKQGPWTDVYGMCATFYRCITGKTPTESLDRIFDDPLKKPSELGVDISPEMEDVLMHGLAVRSEDRISDMAQLRQLLTQARSHKPEYAGYPTPVPTPAVTPVYGQQIQADPRGTQPAVQRPITMNPAQQNIPAYHQAQENRTQAADENENGFAAQQPVNYYQPAMNQPIPNADPNYPNPGYPYQPISPLPPVQEKKKKSARVPIIIGAVAGVLVIAIVSLIIINPFGKSNPDTPVVSTVQPTYSPSSGTVSSDDSSESEVSSYTSSEDEPYSSTSSAVITDGKFTGPLTKIDVLETSDESRIFKSVTDYVISRIDTSLYHFDNRETSSYPLSENGCYKTNTTKTFYTTDVVHNDTVKYNCSRDVKIEGKTYTVGDFTLKDLIKDGWEYEDTKEKPTGNTSSSQGVDMKLKGKTMRVYVSDTGSDPEATKVHSLYIDGPGGYDKSPASFNYHDIVPGDTLEDVLDKLNPPTYIDMYSGSSSGSVEFEYETTDSDLIFKLTFSYDPSSETTKLRELHLAYYD